MASKIKNQSGIFYIKLLREKKVINSSELDKFLSISWNTAQSYLMDLALIGSLIRIKKKV